MPRIVAIHMMPSPMVLQAPASAVRDFRVALVQLDVRSGMPTRNVSRMLECIAQAKREGAHLVVFPEMCVGGYLVGDKWTDTSFCRDLMRYNDALRDATDDIAIIYGNIFVDDSVNKRWKTAQGWHPNKDGRPRKYNAIYGFYRRKPLARTQETQLLPPGIQPKTLLPNYRIFDDQRYFFSLADVAVDAGMPLVDLMQPFLVPFQSASIKVGATACEDMWCADYRANGEEINPAAMMIRNGADLVINISASPWTIGKHDARDRRVKFVSDRVGSTFVPFLFVNTTGAQNNGKNIVTFDGGTTAYNRRGEPAQLIEEPYLETMITVRTGDLDERSVSRRETTPTAQKIAAIVRGIRHMKDILGQPEDPRFIVGLSGGLDSSLAAALLTVAVGKEKIAGINMPTRFNSQKTCDVACHVAHALGIDYQTIPIADFVAANSAIIDRVTLFQKTQPWANSEFHVGNLTAKLRGTAILSNLAAKYQAIFTNNANKLEIALGYSTLYGDWGGALAPLADLTKTEEVAMARYLNTEIFHKEVISERVLPDALWRFRDDQIQPTAELEANQVDPMKFGYHCALIRAMTSYMKASATDVMRWYLDGMLEQQLGVSTELLIRWHIDDPREFIRDLLWFVGLIERNVYKRVQAPPIIITDRSAYGYDIRESMLPPSEPSAEREELTNQILKLKKYAPC